jgi:zinc D-Ala-D-Ala carboxypeptidase
VLNKNKKTKSVLKNISVIRGGVKHFTYQSIEKRPKTRASYSKVTTRKKRSGLLYKRAFINGVSTVIGISIVLGLGGLAEASLTKSDNKTHVQGVQSNFDKQMYSLSETSSIWVMVNDKHPLPADFKPLNLRVPNVELRLPATDEEMLLAPDSAAAFEKMTENAKKYGINLMLGSGFRSYKRQYEVYQYSIEHLGTKEAPSLKSQPGTSEHQTGLGFDVERTDRKCEFDSCFDDTPEANWLAAHAPEYGFIIRYPKGKTTITGHSYESWHLRFVGKELAKELNQNGLTMEEFFNLY